ncbi:6644_t:CDS:2, partial [Funneliformis geosporum]
IVQKSIFRIRDDLDHSKTNGNEMKENLLTLQEELRKGKLNEEELEKKVAELQALVIRKESELEERTEELRVAREDKELIIKQKEILVEGLKIFFETLSKDPELDELISFKDRFGEKEEELKNQSSLLKTLSYFRSCSYLPICETKKIRVKSLEEMEGYKFEKADDLIFKDGLILEKNS